jgi:hypothetical protein
MDEKNPKTQDTPVEAAQDPKPTEPMGEAGNRLKDSLMSSLKAMNEIELTQP